MRVSNTAIPTGNWLEEGEAPKDLFVLCISKPERGIRRERRRMDSLASLAHCVRSPAQAGGGEEGEAEEEAE